MPADFLMKFEINSVGRDPCMYRNSRPATPGKEPSTSSVSLGRTPAQSVELLKQRGEVT